MSTKKNKKKGMSHTSKKFIGVHFKCCNVYNRAYINSEASAYEGYCPCCRKKVYFPIGEGGTSSRFFEAH